MIWQFQVASGTSSSHDDQYLNSNVPLLIILLALTILSFIPQFYQIFSRKNCGGLSIAYVVLNLMTATEEFAEVLLFYVEHAYNSGNFVYKQRTTGDLLNLIQLGLVFVCFAILFIARIVLPPHQETSKAAAVMIYIPWLLITLFPAIDCICNSRDPDENKLGLALTGLLHAFVLTPLATVFGIASLIPQARLLRLRSDRGVISVVGLAVQVVVFVLNALLWPFRVSFDWKGWAKQDHGLALVVRWYSCVGFVAIDTGIFAIVQGALLAIILSRPRFPGISNPETDPLLSHSA